jgi:nucleoid DNA-binding protein
MVVLAGHISYLLHNNDCVIVPGFGGFVAHYRAASIHPTQHIFAPPSKAIAFNRNLSQNDGLLANRVAVAQNCDYQEALRLISLQVQELQFALEQGKKIKLDGVGMFMLDIERNLQFFPSEEVNYLADSFGLTEFQSPAILREGIREKQTVPFQPMVRAPKPENKTVKRSRAGRIITGVSLGLIAGLFALPFLFPDSQIGMNQLSGYFNSGEVKQVTFKPRTSVPETVEIATNIEQTELMSLDFLKDGTSALIIDQRINSVHEADTTRTATVPLVTIRSNEVASFEIIAGCFSVEENAAKYLAQLKQDFPSASIVGKNQAGLYRVSVGSALNRSEAERLLSETRSKLPQAWLLAAR